MKVFVMLILLCSSCYGAELLVKAEDAWGDDPSRSRKGDIIVVRPDGWKWGKEECLPRFIVIKVPNVKAEDLKYLEQPLMDNKDPENPVTLKRRQYSVGAYTDTVKTGTASLSLSNFSKKLTDKQLVVAQ